MACCDVTKKEVEAKYFGQVSLLLVAILRMFLDSE
jgi:hypothetical protein